MIGAALALGVSASFAIFSAVIQVNGVLLAAGPVQVNGVQVSASQNFTVNGA